MNSLFAILFSLTFVLSGIVTAEDLTPVNQWTGKSRDATHKQAGPESGIIVDANAFAELWGKWQAGKPVPQVDFKKDLILTATVSGPNNMRTGRVQLENGNVRFAAASTRMGGPGFGHLFIQIPRAGVTSVNGIPLPAQKEAGAVADSIKVELVGTLRTGVMAVGGETTGTIIRSSNVTWELQLPQQIQNADSLNGKKVLVRGKLTKKPGVEIRERWIVDVDSLEPATTSTGNETGKEKRSEKE